MSHRIAAGALLGPRGVLLAHRTAQRRYYPDCWDFPGGHLEAGESAAEALRRELCEEIGVEAAILGEPRLHLTEGDQDGDGMELRLWVLERWTGEPRNLAPEEHDEIRWVTRAELPALRLAHPAYPELLDELTAHAGENLRSPAHSAGRSRDGR